MSLDYVAYLNDTISQTDILEYVVGLGGTIQWISADFTQGMIQKEDEIIWIHHDQTYFYHELEEDELAVLQSSFGITPKASVVISVGLNTEKRRSISLANWFSQQFLIKYPNAVIGIDDRYYTLETIGNCTF